MQCGITELAATRRQLSLPSKRRATAFWPIPRGPGPVPATSQALTCDRATRGANEAAGILLLCNRLGGSYQFEAGFVCSTGDPAQKAKAIGQLE